MQTKSISMRIIASSSRELAAMVEQGKFRKDLFFRLNVVNLKMPALRERKDDISLLAMHFLAIQDRHDGCERTLSSDLVQLLGEYEWPGNVRELENAIEHACAIADNNVLQITDLPHQVRGFSRQIPVESEKVESVIADDQALHAATDPQLGEILPMAEIERQAILGTLRQLGGDKLKTAKLLGIGKTTLYRKLREYEESEMDPEPLFLT
jgi:two-component system response regulator HydG